MEQPAFQGRAFPVSKRNRKMELWTCSWGFLCATLVMVSTFCRKSGFVARNTYQQWHKWANDQKWEALKMMTVNLVTFWSLVCHQKICCFYIYVFLLLLCQWRVCFLSSRLSLQATNLVVSPETFISSQYWGHQSKSQGAAGLGSSTISILGLWMAGFPASRRISRGSVGSYQLFHRHR